MGVRTIISVDGASPDVARAEARGMRYVHIPITYAEASREQQLEIARAVRDSPGPAFVHCHHGMHRGPAAAASAAVLLGEVTPEEGVAFMKEAGTASSYEGLYACVATASVATSSALDERRRVSVGPQGQGFVAAMIEVDQAFSYLDEIRGGGVGQSRKTIPTWFRPRKRDASSTTCVSPTMTRTARRSAATSRGG